MEGKRLDKNSEERLGMKSEFEWGKQQIQIENDTKCQSTWK